MTLTVHVDVPENVGWTAEVAAIELAADGRPKSVRTQTMRAGESRFFHPHDGAAILVAEGRLRGAGGAALAIFDFGLGQPVRLVGSDERGTVIGRADYAESSHNYLVRYRTGDGCLTEGWWGASALAAVEPVVGIAEPAINGSAHAASPAA